MIGSNDGTVNLLPVQVKGEDVILGDILSLWEDDLIPAQHAVSMVGFTCITPIL